MRKLVLASVIAAASLSACVGSTEPATNVSTLSAQLNAKGFTNDGPATWWWEYDTVKADLGTANDTEVCGNPPEPDHRCGPASAGSSGNPVPLSVTVTGLTPATTYYFRACGQDANDPQPTCGNTLSFQTLAGTAYEYVTRWNTRPNGFSGDTLPSALDTDSSGNVYVLAIGAPYTIQKFDGSGRFIRQWYQTGDGLGFTGAQDLAVDPSSNVIVATPDAGDTAKVNKFNSDGTWISRFTANLTPADRQLVPGYGTDTDAAGNIYIVDTAADRVHVFSPSGTPLRDWGGAGSADGQFDSPLGIGVGNGVSYVTDWGTDRVKAFNANGTFLFKWPLTDGWGVDVDSGGHVAVAGGETGKVFRYNALGGPVATIDVAAAIPAAHHNVVSVASDRQGNLFLGDPAFGVVFKFRPTR